VHRTDTNPGVIRIPPQLRSMSVLDLAIGRNAVDALLGAGLLWFEDLDGRTPESLLSVHGIGRRSVTRILRALATQEARLRTRPLYPPETWSTIRIRELGFGEPAVSAATAKGLLTLGAIRNAPDVLFLDAPRLAGVLRAIVQDDVPANGRVEWFHRAVRRHPAGRELFHIPREFWNLPMTALELNDAVLLQLRWSGLRSLGQLDALTVPDLHWLAGFGQRNAAAVARAVLRLRTVKPPAQVLPPWTDPDGELRLPALPLTVLNAVRRARGLDEELRALVSSLSRRNAAIVLGRWELLHDPPISFRKAAAEQGVSAERARQIAHHHHCILYRAGLRLPIAGRIVETLVSVGGVLHTAEFLSAIERAGIHATPAAVRLLPHLSTLGLVQPIQYVPEVDLWIATGGEDKDSATGFPDPFAMRF